MRGASSSWASTSSARRSMPMRLWARRASFTNVRHIATETTAGTARIPRMAAPEGGSTKARVPMATPAMA